MTPISKQILVVKGWEGFADRLQILSHSIQYCLRNDAILCVDWRDEMWGQGETDFGDYFEITGVETTTIDVVANRIRSGATYYPPSWTATDIALPLSKYRNMKHKIDKNEDMLNEYTKREYDIVIIQNGRRTFHITNLTCNLRFTPEVSQILQTKLKGVVLPFTAVHLRGTDRMTEPVEMTVNNTVSKLQLLPKYQQSRVVVVSDMQSLIHLWLAQYPASTHINPDNGISKIDMGATKCTGSHMLPKEVYDYYGVSKREMNIDTLADFVILSMANWCVGNMETESCFTKMSRFMYNNTGSDGIGAWFGESFVPSRAPIPA